MRPRPNFATLRVVSEQLYVTRTGVTVDPRRFKSKGDAMLFEPFPVRRTEPLREALDQERVKPDDDLLIIAHDGGRATCLSREQMAFHHVAHGEFESQPWVVFF